jgi:RNA polymerase sigma factor (sigma-70 family)
MSKNGMTRLRRYLRKLADVHATDRDLLRRFLDQQDERAFETLVRRHDRLVRSAIGKVLGNAPDAEDAYQATFLVLVRRARAIDWRAGLGPWLYGVAHRVAVKAQVRQTKRVSREGRARPTQAVLPADLSWQEACDLLHAELDQLPETYRMPLLLCYLEGKTREEAGAVLGVTSGTVRGRVKRGLDVLRQRLARRGVALSVGLLAVMAAPSGGAAVVTSPAAVVAAVRGAAPASVTTLAQEVVMGSVLRTAGKVLAMVAVSIGLAAGLLAAAREAQTKPPDAAVTAKGEQESQPAAKAGGPGTLLLARESDLVPLTPDGKEGDALSAPPETRTTHQGRLSPDGTRAAFVVNLGKPRGPDDDLDAPWPFQVVIRKLGATDPIAVVDFSVKGRLTLCWAPDGKKVLVSNDARGDGSLDHVLVDAATGKKDPIDLPATARVLDWSRDGKTFLVLFHRAKRFRLGLTASDKEIRELTELKVRLAGSVIGRLSPDGTKVLFTDADPEQKDAHKWHRSNQPHVLDVATKKRSPLAEFPQDAEALGLAWSPDGKRVAYTWVQLHPELLKKDTISIEDDAAPTEAFLMIADADGKNAKTVSSGKNNSVSNAIFGSIDRR